MMSALENQIFTKTQRAITMLVGSDWIGVMKGGLH